MMAALLPGVREIRTPLMVGSLWLACSWIIFAHRVLRSDLTLHFVEEYGLASVPESLWLGAASLLAYIIGSVLVTERAPLGRLVSWARTRAPYHLVSRMRDRAYMPWRPRWWVILPLAVWRFLSRFGWFHTVVNWFLADYDNRPVLSRLRAKFDGYGDKGLVPIVDRYGVPGGVSRGFYRIDRQASGRGRERQEVALEYLFEQYANATLNERSEIEVRIQLRHPSLFSDIDRLQTEASLRYSIFWPSLILIAALAFAWSPFALTLLPVPFVLVLDGRQRLVKARSKTWGAVESGEVTSPTIDEVDEMPKEPVGGLADIQEHFQVYSPY